MCENLAVKKAKVFGTSNQLCVSKRLDFVTTGHPFTDPVALIASFYTFIEHLASSRGRNPDQPRLLKKVTTTIGLKENPILERDLLMVPMSTLGMHW